MCLQLSDGKRKNNTNIDRSEVLPFALLFKHSFRHDHPPAMVTRDPLALWQGILEGRFRLRDYLHAIVGAHVPLCFGRNNQPLWFLSEFCAERVLQGSTQSREIRGGKLNIPVVDGGG